MSPQVSPRASQSTTPALDTFLSTTNLPEDQVTVVKQFGTMLISKNPQVAVQIAWEATPEPQKAQVRSYTQCGIGTVAFLVALVVVQVILGILTMTRSIPPTYAGLLLFGTSALILVGCALGGYKGYSVYKQLASPCTTATDTQDVDNEVD